MNPNRLIYEKSPYLRQHAYNPVNWYPWCKDAFEIAQKENKPIFLSIGYSTCHWCHVMEKESFEDEEIAEILNRFFISIKVDREERPDIDSIYMKVCYLFQNRGGWPLTILMTADKKPFYADTYIPKDDLYGKFGLKKLLLRIVDLWENNSNKIREVSEGITESLKKIVSKSNEKIALSESTIHKAYEGLRIVFDKDYGGFGKSPKFPLPLNFLFLHRYFYRYKNMTALDMSLQTLKKMRLGGIYDHLGFGFHRYSTDREWILPHFEKMLYDNALLMLSYAEAFQITKDEFFKTVAEEIATYLLRDMYSSEGAFYSAEDADSEGKEGEFYLWTYDEIEQTLTEEEFNAVKIIYSLSKEGNFYEEATKQKNGKNIIHIEKSLEVLSEDLNIEKEELINTIESIRYKLFNKRQSRVKPARDEKILTDWNSLGIVAFCKTGIIFEKYEYIDIAEKCMSFLLNNMFDNSGKLLHRFVEGEASVFGYLEDYAYLIWALIELYFATFKNEYLLKALELTDFTIEHFMDKENGAFYHTADYAEIVIERIKEIYDGVVPSGNSLMAYNFLRLSRLIQKREYEQLANKIIYFFSKDIEKIPASYIFSIISLDLLINGSMELIAIPNASKEDEIKFLRSLQREFVPNLLPMIKDSFMESIFDWTKLFEKIEGNSTYYLCKNFTCQSPMIDRVKLMDFILNS